MPLTTKDAEKVWPTWTRTHDHAFETIKQLVLSCQCLTAIDHDNLGDNKIYVTCDASNRRTGACLSYGPSWETAQPVAFDSMQFTSAQLHYPTHEQELLAIVRALSRWRDELLGIPFIVRSDHRTLEHFLRQPNLSRRQTRWSEFL